MSTKKAESNERKIKILQVNEITAKNGNKFLAYKTIGKNGRKLDVRFVRDCANVPKEPCIIVVKNENANVDESRIYPIVWVKNVERIEKYERKSNLDEYFNDDNVETVNEI